MALDNAINSAQNFKEAETHKIIAAQSQFIPGGAQSSSTPTGGSPSSATATGGAPSPAPVVTPVKCVKLKVAHSTPLKTEAEVDSYMAGLKAQLMAEINAGSSIIVQ